MPKLVCAAIECRFNKDNLCKSGTVRLSDGHIHTVHQGYKQIWECKTYEISSEAKQISEELKSFLSGKGLT